MLSNRWILPVAYMLTPFHPQIKVLCFELKHTETLQILDFGLCCGALNISTLKGCPNGAYFTMHPYGTSEPHSPPSSPDVLIGTITGPVLGGMQALPAQ